MSVPRLPGHGTTWQEMNRTTFADWYAEVERAYEKLRSECDEVVVGGLSMGGALVLRLADDHADDVAGVVLVNPAVSRPTASCSLFPVLKRLRARASTASATTSRSRASPSTATPRRR